MSIFFHRELVISDFAFQLPKFYYLCEDGVWGVRKACAECFMVVSRACTSETRRSQLSGIFVNLLCDLSRWVSLLRDAMFFPV